MSFTDRFSKSSLRVAGYAFTMAAWAITVVGSSTGGCISDPGGFQPTTSSSSSGSGSGGAGGAAVNLGAEMFEELKADFIDECGSCHKIGGSADTPFLGDVEGGSDDTYEAVTSWPGIIVADPQLSVLIRWPADGSHSGPPPSAGLETALLDWLTEEAKAVDVIPNDKKTIPPFKPIVPGFNAVYLDPLGADFVGMAVTFQAEELTDSSLSLTTLEIHPTAKKGLSFEHPLFTVYAPGSSDGDPDPVDSFSNVMQDVEPGETAPLGPGTVVLTNWVVGGKLSLNFETISVIDPTAMGGAGGGMAGGACGALVSFENNAQGPLGACTNCHGGGNQTATNALDMSELTSNADEACGQVKNRVNFMNPAQSQIFVNTDPSGNASHPFKFGGNQGNHTNFVNSVSQWITAEGAAQ